MSAFPVDYMIALAGMLVLTLFPLVAALRDGDVSRRDAVRCVRFPIVFVLSVLGPFLIQLGLLVDLVKRLPDTVSHVGGYGGEAILVAGREIPIAGLPDGLVLMLAGAALILCYYLAAGVLRDQARSSAGGDDDASVGEESGGVVRASSGLFVSGAKAIGVLCLLAFMVLLGRWLRTPVWLLGWCMVFLVVACLAPAVSFILLTALPGR